MNQPAANVMALINYCNNSIKI